MYLSKELGELTREPPLITSCSKLLLRVLPPRREVNKIDGLLLVLIRSSLDHDEEEEQWNKNSNHAKGKKRFRLIISGNLSGILYPKHNCNLRGSICSSSPPRRDKGALGHYKISQISINSNQSDRNGCPVPVHEEL